MITRYKQLFGVAAVAVLGACVAQAQTPVALTGWNGPGFAAGPANVGDVTGYIWSNLGWAPYENGAPGSTSPGLPASGLLTSAGGSHATFQLQPFAGPNVEYMPDGFVRTLTLNTPAALGTAVQFLSWSTGSSSWTVTLNFDAVSGGGSDSLGTTSTAPWIGGGGTPAVSVGIMNSSGGYWGGGTIGMYENDLSVPLLDQSKIVDSVSLQLTGGPQMEVLAMAADVQAIPEPSSLVLVGMGALTLLGFGRIRRRS